MPERLAGGVDYILHVVLREDEARLAERPCAALDALDVLASRAVAGFQFGRTKRLEEARRGPRTDRTDSSARGSMPSYSPSGAPAGSPSMTCGMCGMRTPPSALPSASRAAVTVPSAATVPSM